MWLRVAAGCLALVCFAPGAIAARNCGPASIQISVVDGTGTSVEGLSADDFRVNMRGNPIRAQSMSYGIVPHSSLVLLDVSASMGQGGKLELGRQVGLTLASQTPGASQLATYAVQASALSDARATLVSSSIQAATDTGHALYDAIAASVRAMRPHFGDTIFVITDSPDSGSRMTASELQDLLVGFGSRLFYVVMPGTTVSQEMQWLSATTGGAVYRPLAGDAVGARFDEAVRNTTAWQTQIANVYTLEFQEQRPGDKPQALKVNLDKKKTNGGQMIAPAFMSPCSAISE